MGCCPCRKRSNDNVCPADVGPVSPPHDAEHDMLSAELNDLQGTGDTKAGLINLRSADVTIGRMLGEGAHGEVHEGTWRGFAVALKFCQPDKDDVLMHEGCLLYTLCHPHIMKVYGICEDQAPSSWTGGFGPPCLCVELMRGGGVLEFLAAPFPPAATPSPRHHWEVVCCALRDVACGLAYLHSLHVMHRDVKMLNLMFDVRKRAKLIDFGLAKFSVPTVDIPAQSCERSHTTSIGTYTHMAPEVLSGDYGLAADVFSFGIVLVEALAAEEAEEVVESTRTKSFGLNVDGVIALLDPIRHPVACRHIVDLSASCCDLDSSKRPPAADLLHRLDVLAETFQKA